MSPRPASSRLYRALLRLLPAPLVDEYGDEMEAAFREQCDHARAAHGPLAPLAVWSAALWDVGRGAAYERWRRRHRVNGHTHRSPERVMHSFVADLRFAARSFARQKGATALVVLTLALAVAANTAVFALLDGVFFRPFPFPQPERLVYLNEQAPKWNLEFTGISYADFRTWRGRVPSVEAMALYDETNVSLVDRSGAERVPAARVTADLPAVLGVRPLLGRTFTAEEDTRRGAPVVVLGHGLWQTRFAGRRDVIGQTLRVNAREHTIIGVLPEPAEFPAGAKLWLALRADSANEVGSYSYDGVARLKPGATIDQVRRDLVEAHRAVWRARDTAKVVSPRAMLLRERFVSDFTVMGKALGAAVGLVLLIACANVAGAMLSRSIMRRREVGIRMALGASAGRIERQLLTESLLLALVAGVVGTALGVWGLRAFVAALGDQFPTWIRLGPSVHTVGFGVLVVVGTALLFGLAPALQVRRQDVRAAISESATRSTSASAGQKRMLHALVVVEIALASVLLAAGALLLQAYGNLTEVEPGFRVDGVASFRVSLPGAKYATGREQRQLYEALEARLKAVPGVQAVGMVSCPPLTCHWGNFLTGEGVVRPPNAESPVTLMRVTTPEYLRAMDIRLTRGRYFRLDEWQPRGYKAVVVNESFAKHMWPGVADPTGRRIRWNGRDTSGGRWMTVVGVTRDDRHYGLATPMRPSVFLPRTWMDSSNGIGSAGYVLTVASGDPARVLPAARAAVRAVDPELPLYDVGTMRQALDRSLATRRIVATSLAAFAGIALTLAVGGIYAVLSYVVGRRRHEIGIRVALGAQRRDVLALVVRQGLRLVVLGLVLGLPLAFAASQALSTLLVGVTAKDPLTYAAVALVLALTGAVAALVPARRAAGVQPTVALVEGGQ